MASPISAQQQAGSPGSARPPAAGGAENGAKASGSDLKDKALQQKLSGVQSLTTYSDALKAYQDNTPNPSQGDFLQQLARRTEGNIWLMQDSRSAQRGPRVVIESRGTDASLFIGVSLKDPNGRAELIATYDKGPIGSRMGLPAIAGLGDAGQKVRDLIEQTGATVEKPGVQLPPTSNCISCHRANGVRDTQGTPGQAQRIIDGGPVEVESIPLIGFGRSNSIDTVQLPYDRFAESASRAAGELRSQGKLSNDAVTWFNDLLQARRRP